MSTQQLLALDLLLVVLSCALFLAAGCLTLSLKAGSGRAPAVTALVCAVLAVLVTASRVVVVVVLAQRGWWFASEKVILAMPLALLTAVVAGGLALPVLFRSVTGRSAEFGRSRAAASLLTAGYGAGAGLLVAFVVGYPVTVADAFVVTALVLGVSGLTWLVVTGQGSRRGWVAGLITLLVVPVLVGAGLAFYRNIQPVVLGDSASGHGHLAAGGASASVDGDPTGTGVSVADLRTPADLAAPVRSFRLVARQESAVLPSGRTVETWTFGSLPGPEIRVQQGDLVEVTLENRDIADGVTLHWHGYPVPNGEDGVAGVTQDAVAPGQSFNYRFLANDVGTYWYHAHQVSSEAVSRGLFGAFVVEPAGADVVATDPADIVVPVHTFDGIPTVAGTDRVDVRQIAPGTVARLRLINTDAEPRRISIDGTPFTVVAVDGTELTGPTPVTGRVLRIPAGGRYDVAFQMPDHSVDLAVEGAGATGLRLEPGAPTSDGAADLVFVDGTDLDLLGYGVAAPVPGMTDAVVTREATLVLDRQFRFLHGIPTLAQTINGEVDPYVPPIQVAEGDLLRLTVVNRGSETHPMHPHGHRVLVESRNGEPTTGSPLWLDTFDVQPGEVWQVLLRADNPGIWMAHCHNLEHATQGMVVHLTYEGVSTPYELGGGAADNRPE
jgi:FtsP/CotA-like multicopper oxidase with cupredoxin domain